MSINSFFFLMMHLQSPRYGIFTTWRFLVSNQFIASEWKRRKQKWMKGYEKSLPTTSCSTKHVVLSWCTNHALLGFLYQMGYIHAYRNETEMIRWKKMIHKMNYMHPPTFGVFWLLIFSSCKTKHSIVHKKSYKFCWWSLIWCNKPL